MKLAIPSERNFEIYHVVMTQRLSRREVAARFKISPTRVQQIIAQVHAFALRQGGDELIGIEPEAIELCTLNLCYARLEYLYRLVMRGLRAVEDRGVLPPSGMRFVRTASRMLIEQTQVAGRIGKRRCAMLEEGTLQRYTEPIELIYSDDEDEPEENAASAATAVTPATTAKGTTRLIMSPPTRGCTEEPSSDVAAALEATRSLASNLGGDDGCDDILAAMQRHKQAKTKKSASARRRRPRESKRLVADGGRHPANCPGSNYDGCYAR